MSKNRKSILSTSANLSESTMSPESLAIKLDRYCTDLATSHKSEYCDLVDFDVEVYKI